MHRNSIKDWSRARVSALGVQQLQQLRLHLRKDGQKTSWLGDRDEVRPCGMIKTRSFRESGNSILCKGAEDGYPRSIENDRKRFVILLPFSFRF